MNHVTIRIKLRGSEVSSHKICHIWYRRCQCVSPGHQRRSLPSSTADGVRTLSSYRYAHCFYFLSHDSTEGTSDGKKFLVVVFEGGVSLGVGPPLSRTTVFGHVTGGTAAFSLLCECRPGTPRCRVICSNARCWTAAAPHQPTGRRWWRTSGIFLFRSL